MNSTILKTIYFYILELCSGIMAGVSISLGGLAYLCCTSKVVGSLFFVVGLFIVLFFDFNLFTGRICFALDKKPNYIINLVLIWLGNFAGAAITSLLLLCTRLEVLQFECSKIVNIKLNDSLISLLLLAIACNMLIFVAVYGFKRGENLLTKGLALFFGVAVFVLCGFEHCVADMFYFTFANAWNIQSFAAILVITGGNIFGGLFMAGVVKLKDKISTTRQTSNL